MTTIHSQAWQSSGTGIGSSRWRKVPLAVSWTLQVVGASVFLLAGTGKLAGAAPMVRMFEIIGVGRWLRYVTGTIEVVSAVLLLVPSLALFGALALSATMVGAILTHVFIAGGSPVPAMALLVVTTTIAWARRSGR